MVKQMYAVFDEAAKAYLEPIYCVTEAQAVRSFTQAAVEEGHNFNVHARDFTLFYVGMWDDECAKMVAPETPKAICTALEARARYRDQVQMMRTMNSMPEEPAAVRQLREDMPGIHKATAEEEA